MHRQSHSGFTWPWSTLVAFKEYRSRANWYRSAAEIDLEIRKRVLPAKSGTPLRHFDGSTHFSYQMPQKPIETVFCRAANTPEECTMYRGYSPDYINVPVSCLEVKESTLVNSGDKIGVFALNDIPKNAGIALDQQVKGFITRPTTWSIIKSLEAKTNEAAIDARDSTAQLVNYLEGFGFCSNFLVSRRINGQ